ncbi:transcription factor Ouib [Drosophila biarmipes]|uniref:transcription factor Ouib n=1 Tax=Drosophila biarmipes TaxID=125945 RepID=UPI0007E61B75|nr:transcription factor Ouib [Drosophila biarmipes]
MPLRNCRTCGKFIFSATPKNLFQEPDSVTLHQIEALTGLFLLEGSGQALPVLICALCEKELEEAISFRERVILTQKALQSNPSNEAVMDFNESIAEDFVEEVTEVEVIDMLLEEQQLPEKQAEEEVVQEKEQPPPQEHHKNPPKGTPLACTSVKFADNSQDNNHRPRTQWDRLTEEEVVALKRERRRRECICEQCGRHFSCPSNFKLHLLRHTGVKGFACDQCPHRFYTATLLRRHQEVHLGTAPYQCRYCEVSFNNATGRVQHERSRHTHVKPFKCKECDKSFAMSGKLRMHMLSHTGVRAFHCESCKVSFVRRSHLVTHYRSKGHAQVAGTQEAVEKTLELDVETVLEGDT